MTRKEENMQENNTFSPPTPSDPSNPAKRKFEETFSQLKIEEKPYKSNCLIELDKMWEKIDRLMNNGSGEEQQAKKRKEDSQICPIHKVIIRVKDENEIEVINEHREVNPYLKKSYICSALKDEPTKNRLKNNYAKGKRYEKSLLTFYVGEKCECVEKLKKEKCFGNGHTSFILESALERDMKEQLQQKQGKKEREVFVVPQSHIVVLPQTQPQQEIFIREERMKIGFLLN